MRSVAGYVLAPILALLLLGGGIALIVVGVTSYNDRIEDFQRAREGSTFDVRLGATGGYSIYYESDDDSASYDELLRDLPFTPSVTDPDGDAVDVQEYDSDVSYDVGRYQGQGIYTFSAEDPGTYRVSTRALGEPSGDIAVGRGIGTRLAGSLVAGISLIALGPLVGALLAVATFLRRSRARRGVAAPAASIG